MLTTCLSFTFSSPYILYSNTITKTFLSQCFHFSKYVPFPTFSYVIVSRVVSLFVSLFSFSSSLSHDYSRSSYKVNGSEIYVPIMILNITCSIYKDTRYSTLYPENFVFLLLNYMFSSSALSHTLFYSYYMLHI